MFEGVNTNDKMVNEIINMGFLKSPRIIEAFRAVDRANFVPKELRKEAYYDMPLPLAEDQSISQPLTVAAMTEALSPEKGHNVLEIGTGSGYQAAILSVIVGNKGKVITVERLEKLVSIAEKNLKGYRNVKVVIGDGTLGWPENAPFDRVIVTASAPHVPQPLIEQLAVGGRLVIPVKDEMFLIKKTKKEEIEETSLGYYMFVPLVGKYGYSGEL